MVILLTASSKILSLMFGLSELQTLLVPSPSDLYGDITAFGEAGLPEAWRGRASSACVYWQLKLEYASLLPIPSSIYHARSQI